MFKKKRVSKTVRFTAYAHSQIAAVKTMRYKVIHLLIWHQVTP
jgi:hypothetical protein